MKHHGPAYMRKRLRLTKKAANLIADMFSAEDIGPHDPIVGEVLMMMIGGWYEAVGGHNPGLRRQILKGVAELIDLRDSTETAH